MPALPQHHVDDARVDEQPSEEEQPGDDGEHHSQRAVDGRGGRHRPRHVDGADHLQHLEADGGGDRTGQECPPAHVDVGEDLGRPQEEAGADSNAHDQVERREEPGQELQDGGHRERGGEQGAGAGQPQQPEGLVLHSSARDLPRRVVDVLERCHQAESRPQQADEADDRCGRLALASGRDRLADGRCRLALAGHAEPSDEVVAEVGLAAGDEAEHGADAQEEGGTARGRRSW